jgi:hypothetical protein
MSYRYVPPLANVGNGITTSSGARLAFFDQGTTTPKTTYGDFALTAANSHPVVADSDGLFGDIFLDVAADVTLRDGTGATGTLIYGPKTVFPPDNSIAALAASVIAVLDTGGNYTATNVEAALTEIASDYMRQNRAETITGTKTFSGANLEMADNQVIRPVFTDYAVTNNTISSVAGALVIDMEAGNSFDTLLTENVTISLTKPPATGSRGQIDLEIVQDGAGGAFTVAWPGSVTWPGGTAPVMSTGNGAVDSVTVVTRDGGATWRGFFSQVFS